MSKVAHMAGLEISRRSFVSLTAATATLIAAGSQIPLATPAHALNDYPWADASRYPSGLSALGFYYRNCTDFTAWRINKQLGVPAGPWRFTWNSMFNYPGGSGHAIGWLPAAQRAGYRCDKAPSLGSVAWWGSSRGDLGHVAIVTAVRGSVVDVESYNGYRETWYPESGVQADYYLHIADIGPAAPAVAQYAGFLVQWRDQSPRPTTTWLVGPDLTRTWVPDGGTFNWMKAAGAPGPALLGASELDALRDLSGVRATTDQLGVNWAAPRNTTLWSTANGYALIFQGDGNLVCYAPGARAIWASRTNADRCVMQGDGNLVLYRGASTAVWWSGTDRQGPSRLVMQADGNVVIYRADGRATWNTRTVGGANRLANPAGFRLV